MNDDKIIKMVDLGDCETINFSDDIKLLSKEKVYEGKVEKMIISTVWNSHGKLVPFPGRNAKNSETINNSNILIENCIHKFFESTFKTTELYINGEHYNADIYKAKGTSKLLKIIACIGEG